MSELQKISDEEKAEIITISSLNSVKKTSDKGHYIAISPDGTQIATLNTETLKIKLCKSENLTELHNVGCESFKRIDAPSWSLAVSDEITLANGTVYVLIAVSCFDDEFMNNSHSNEKNVNINMHKKNDIIKHPGASTWIISFARQSRISTSINNLGGIVKFLDKDSNSTNIVLINTDGINKFSINHEKINDIIRCRGENDVNDWYSLFFPEKSIEKFYFPAKFLKRNYESYSSLIQRSLIKDRLIVENYKNKIQTIEIYNLKTNLLENTLQKYEDTTTSIIGKGSPCFAISDNESLFAYCHGANTITIYLMENGLEIITKKFNEMRVRILSFYFVQDDSKLLIIIEEITYNEDTAENIISPFIVVWDLFSISDNCIRSINNNFSLLTTNLVNSSGNIITITESGNIFSIFEKPEMIKLLDPEDGVVKNKISLEKPDSFSSTNTSPTTPYYLIYNYLGESLNPKTELSNGVIIVNSEPWHNKLYNRISAYLDDDKSIQLIIGESTVQVWNERKSGSLSKKILEYIWTNNHMEQQRQMKIQSLEVGHRKFSLTLCIPSGITSKLGHEIKLEWPEKVNNPVDACQAMEFLDKKKNDPSDQKKQHEFEYLVQQTEYIIKKYLIKNHSLWRMMDIRFDIMANLIRGNCVSIIKNMLFFDFNKKEKNLHIPRCYSWDGRIKETDLEIAIKCSEGGYRKDTIIVKYLLDYYSDNALKTSNWMFTVTKTIPLLYQNQLEFYVKELFQKPCFGINNVYLEQSKISKKDVIKSNDKDIHAFNVNLVYPEKINYEQNYWMVPIKLLKLLIWPRGHVFEEEETLSPFLRMIRNNDSAEIYDNPSIAAIIDYKWNSARGFFLRHAILYLLFALMFSFVADAVKDISLAMQGNNSKYSNASMVAFYVLFYWLGFYLLNTERIQLKYDGLKRYFNIFNFFDLISVICPLMVASAQLYYYLSTVPSIKIDLDGDFNPEKVLRIMTICNSFSILLVWLQLALLLRYFQQSGTYIYVIVHILKQIIPFLIFMLTIVFGFGHAMFILLSNTQNIGIQPDGSTYLLNNTIDGEQYKMDQEINVQSASDNYFSDFTRSVESVFFWTGGRWDQLEQWNFWPVDVYSIIGSILLVTILQNMLIAMMTGAYDDAKAVGKYAVLKYRAELIADYETIDTPFGREKENPRYIYFFGNSDYIQEWLENSEKARNNISDSPKKWLVDEDYKSENELSNNKLSIIQKDNVKNEVKILQDKIQSMDGKLHSMEENIKNLISLLQNQQK
ncbi:15529_t:CDS:2 [Rhizophagus irregularis]|nr:15529_t:CDS:2 [Rhizophagus irregularis]